MLVAWTRPAVSTQDRGGESVHVGLLPGARLRLRPGPADFGLHVVAGDPAQPVRLPDRAPPRPPRDARQSDVRVRLHQRGRGQPDRIPATGGERPGAAVRIGPGSTRGDRKAAGEAGGLVPHRIDRRRVHRRARRVRTQPERSALRGRAERRRRAPPALTDSGSEMAPPEEREEARRRAEARLAAVSWPSPLLGALERLRQGGHQALLVGGTVRDTLLGRTPDATSDVATDL